MIPAVTVVIALYNKVHFVKATIESVLQQSFTDFQLIMIDDGSTDGSLEIVKQFNDDRLSLYTIKNSGPGHARNEGLRKTTTKYISFLDADDQWHPDFLKEALQALDAHPESDVWLCSTLWQPQNEYRLPFLNREKNKQQSGVWKLETDYTPLETAEVLNFFATGAVVARTEVIKKYGGYFDALRCTSGEDGYLWLQVMYNHLIIREPRALLIIHTDGSDLGIGRRSLKPVPPWLDFPEHVLKHCPFNYLNALRAYFDLSAFLAFRREVYQGHFWKAFRLVCRYPKLSHYRSPEYPVIVLALVWYPLKHYSRLVLKKI
jgi:glycosyltransferase involved in cell wall biosynthesis